ncbi:MAG: peptide-N-glycosidase F-related protein [Polyangiaceae bacterium]
MRSLLGLTVALCLGVTVWGCSDDSTSDGSGGSGGTGGSAGQGGSTSGGSAGSSTAGSAGASTGGSAGTAGTGGTGGNPNTFEIQAFDRDRITSDGSQPNFQHIETDVDFKQGPFEKVTLIVDLESTCYPFDSWLGANPSNPPPSGQNWPADCDAFDRNFEFTLDEPTQDGEPPAIELVRAITPFGGPLHFEIDITDVANGIAPGTHRLRSHISTWSDGAGQVSGSNGGWFVSAKIQVSPGPAPRNVLAVIPLYNGSHGAMSPDAINFDIPAGTTSTRVEYRATGHGGVFPSPGCNQPGEEFCKRDHRFFADGAQFDRQTPWRTDCKDLCTRKTFTTAGGGSFEYCEENPCGAIASVEAQRANWCPGSVTPPINFERSEYNTAGQHSFAWTISPVADGGSWRVSALLFAFGD